jgi:predicted kinase
VVVGAFHGGAAGDPRALRRLLDAQHNVILDAAFLKKERRDAARAVATSANLDAVLVYPAAPADVLRARIAKRATLKDEASEADLAVLEHQLGTAEEPVADESALVIDTSGDIDIEELVKTIRCKLSSTP